VIRVIDYDSERLGDLIGALPVAPQGWIQAAKELPQARRGIDHLIARAEADAEFRARVLADLESTLAAEGVEPSPPILAVFREHFATQ
jgi:hypothetical protein